MTRPSKSEQQDNAAGQERQPTDHGRVNPVRSPQAGTTPAPAAPSEAPTPETDARFDDIGRDYGSGQCGDLYAARLFTRCLERQRNAALDREREQTEAADASAKLADDLQRQLTAQSASGAPTLRWLQENLPWTLPYSEHFEATAYPLDRVKHDVLHVMKSLGRVAAECENHDHGRDRKLYGPALAKEVADFVICALHIAKLEGFDLQDAVIDNSGTRNGVDLRAAIASSSAGEWKDG